MSFVKVELTEEDQLKNVKRAGTLSREIMLLEMRRQEINKKLKAQIGQFQADLDLIHDEMRTGVRMERAQSEMFDGDEEDRTEHLQGVVKDELARLRGEDA
jgi:hypothetical protein